MLVDDSSTLNNKDDHINHVYSCTSKKDTHSIVAQRFTCQIQRIGFTLESHWIQVHC